MKKIILLLFITTSLSAQTVEFNYYPTYDLYDYSDELYFNFNSLFSISITLDYELGVFNFYGSTETFMVKRRDGITFTPLVQDYHIGVFVPISIFYIGIEHRCSHPINSYEGLFNTVHPLNTSLDRFYIGINF